MTRGVLEHARLWLSYQRYGLLLVGGSVGVMIALLALAPGAWWAWGPAALVLFHPARFGVTVLGRWRRKLRATVVAERRIGAGRFRPESLRPYCGDPCFRVVAHEILRRAGMPRPERKALVARLRDEQLAARDVLMLVNHEQGTVTIIDGQGRARNEARVPSAPYA